MQSAIRIILALSLPLVACGHSKPDLFLDQTTTALECASSNDPECTAGDVPGRRSRDSVDAGAPRSRLDGCYGDGDCEYGEVCERRHGVSLCQPEDDGQHGHDGGSGGDAGHGGDGSAPDAGSAGCAGDDHPKCADDCSGEGDKYEDDHDADRSGSNSGRH